MRSGSAWLRRFHPAAPGAPALVCLPHAGGTASAYFALSARLRPAVEVQAVQYPGHQDRYAEPAAVAMDDLVDGLTAAVRSITDRPYALFGHSMGAVVAYELALRLQRDGARDPLWFFASGRRAPSRLRAEDLHRRPDEELIAHVGRLGGVQPEMLEDADVRAMVLPAMRADYTLVENYRAQAGGSVACPVTVFVGNQDGLVDPDEAAAWKEHTQAGFELESFPGGHFYLIEHIPALASKIAERLVPAAPSALTSPSEGVRMSEERVAERIRDCIRANFLGGDPGLELEDTSPLLEWGVLNSLNTVRLVGFIRDELGVTVPPVAVNGLNFKDVRSITHMVLAHRV